MTQKIPKGRSVPEVEKRQKSFMPKRRTSLDTPVCLVVDGMNIAYQAFYAYNKLSYKGKPTHIIFGFPQILKGLINQYRPEKVVVCWEGERHPERLKACPGYKGHRADRPKSMSKAIKRTQILLKNLGIAQAYNPNMEGDDMIYWVTKKYQGLYKIVIASGDKDMHQLINHDITVFCPRRKLPFTPFAFLPDHGCEMFQYVDYLCLVGDKSDDIPGYRGIGPVRASAFFTRFKSIKEYLNNPNAEFSGISDKELLEEIYTRNKIMIDLEHFNTKFHSKKDVTFYKNKLNPAFKEDRVRAFCVKYNLRTFLTDTFLGTFKKLSS